MDRLKRNSNIELLRVVAMCGVIMLHYFASPGKLLESVKLNTLNHHLIILINQICVCSVDIFILITGYFNCKRKYISIKKCVQLLLQVLVFQIGITAINLFRTGGGELKTILISFVPHNYYVTLYIPMLLLSPFINFFTSTLRKKQFQLFLIFAIILFAVQPTIIDIMEGVSGDTILGASMIGILGAEWGYTIVTFVLVYIIGSYVRLNGFPVKRTFTKLCLLLACVILLVAWKQIEIKIGRSIGAEHYQNPIIIISAVVIFDLFNSMKINIKYINWVSMGSFTVYLSHSVIMHFFSLTDYVNDNLFIIKLFFYTVIIYFIGNTMGIIYSTIENKLFDKLEKMTGFFLIKMNGESND